MKKTLQVVVLSLSLIGSSAFAGDKKGKHHEWKEPTKEERMKMAEMHSKMADCLKSEKTAKECHEEMKDHCKDMGDACPMHKMHKMHGKHHGDKMKEKEAE